MPANKKHHFVPRFYLKRFSPDGKSINLYNIPNSRRILRANLKNQCYRDYFYGKDLKVEQSIAAIETEAADILRKIDECSCPPPPFSAEHVSLITHVAIQQARTEYEADALNEINDAMIQKMMGPVMAAKGIDLSKFKVNLAEPGAFGVSVACNISPLAMDLRYKLLIDKTGEGFVTCDNPVVALNPLLSFRSFGSNCGIAAKGLQLYFPIDPAKLLLFYDGLAYGIGSKHSPIIEITNPADIHNINALQMCSASANIYFMGEHLDVQALYRKAKPHLRVRKSRLRVIKDGARDRADGSMILGSSREDIRANPPLTFVSLRTSAKRWREKARRAKLQPVVEVRDPELLKVYRQFQEDVRKGRATASDFYQGMMAAFRELETDEAARRSTD